MANERQEKNRQLVSVEVVRAGAVRASFRELTQLERERRRSKTAAGFLASHFPFCRVCLIIHWKTIFGKKLFLMRWRVSGTTTVS